MPFRILTLDGGGSWALIEVRTLINLYGEKMTGHQILRNFDLVAANSGGSLVLAGLIENLSLAQILDYFMDENNRRSIFSPTKNPGDEALRSLLDIGPKYSSTAKLPAIERFLPATGDAPLAGCLDQVIGPNKLPVHALIIGFDYDRNRAVFFRSAAATSPDWGEGQPANISVAGAVHASTNAPVNYFDGPALLPLTPDRYWDGGITGCNNPVVAALVESIVLGRPPQDANVLCLGTGTVSLPLSAAGAPDSPFEAPRLESSVPTDLKKLATAIVDDPPDAATFISHAITGGNAVGLPPGVVSRVVRMSPLICPVQATNGGWRAPGNWPAATFQYLCNIDMDALTEFDVTYISNYCSIWHDDLAPNQPIRMRMNPFDPWNPEIGYARYSEAKSAWVHLFPLAPMA